MKLLGNWLKIKVWTTKPCLQIQLPQNALKARNIDAKPDLSTALKLMNNQPFETERMHPGQCQSIYAMVFSATFCTNTQGDRELV